MAVKKKLLKPMKGVLGFTEDLVVSQDFVGDSLELSLMLMGIGLNSLSSKSSLGMIMNMDT
jgi:hypothetical protein